MTAYAWPTAWVPSAFELRVLPNTRTFVGAYTPVVQVVDLMGGRWQGRIDLPPTNSLDEAGSREGFFDRLVGPANQITLWNFRRATPRGTGRGVMTLAASALQSANSVTVGGVTNGVNLLVGGSFEVDTNADGMADLWARYSGGTTGALSNARSGWAQHGAWSQQVSAAGLGTTSSDRVGLLQTGANIAAAAGQTVTASAYLLGSLSGTKGKMLVQFFDAGASSVGVLTSADLPITGGVQQITVSGSVPSNAVTADIYVYIHSAPSTPAAAIVSIDAVQLQVGAAATTFLDPGTLLAGDMLGINGQLVRVMADATANDAGKITVEFQPRLRAAQSSGAAVSWNKPTCNVMLKGAEGVATTYHPGYADGCSFEFVEVP